MAHSIIYLDQDVRDRLEVLRDSEEFEDLPEEVKILIRLYFMWEDADG